MESIKTLGERAGTNRFECDGASSQNISWFKRRSAVAICLVHIINALNLS
jgi:hypothetical protein